MTLTQIILLLITIPAIYKLVYQPTGKNALPSTPTQLSLADIQLLENSPLYKDLARAMMACVTGVYQNCGLLCPKILATHMALPGRRVVWDEQKGLLFQYVFYRVRNTTGGLQFTCSTTPVIDMVNILNQSIGNCTQAVGWYPLQIVKCKDLSLWRVSFYLAPFPNLVDLQGYLANLKNYGA